ncbi:Mobile element protein [hydrothermal vent metagenome]|uniref:Mobile element protein n=1 Tax=hydrothermal vent metagenome TaxID=652676 RepID=A0A3B0VZZ3_9ZZZZ
MTIARKYQISLEDTPYYHIMTRCVRRAFLCGKDRYTGNCYEHRREMIVNRIKVLADVFNIDVCAYAIMSNHYHLVLKINSTESWNEKQVLTYWSCLCKLPILCDRFIKGEHLTKAELDWVYLETDVYRTRLMSISWFMKMLNEYISRTANTEEELSGTFWESRFKSQALLDEKALLTCMAYVDLNPIRAAMAQTPEDSDYTSIQERIKNKDSKLLAFGFGSNDINFALSDYCDLVDATGKSILVNKKGVILSSLPPILHRLGLDESTWIDELNQFKTRRKSAVGTVEKLKNYITNIKWKIKRDIGLKPALE